MCMNGRYDNLIMKIARQCSNLICSFLSVRTHGSQLTSQTIVIMHCVCLIYYHYLPYYYYYYYYYVSSLFSLLTRKIQTCSEQAKLLKARNSQTEMWTALKVKNTKYCIVKKDHLLFKKKMDAFWQLSISNYIIHITKNCKDEIKLIDQQSKRKLLLFDLLMLRISIFLWKFGRLTQIHSLNYFLSYFLG